MVEDLTGRVCQVTDVGTNVAGELDGTAYVLSSSAAAGTLAGAILWGQRHHADRVVLFLDDLGGDIARMAVWFSADVEVRTVAGSTSSPAVSAPLPVPFDAPSDPELEAQLRAGGLEVVVEHGAVRGEIKGLEVARLVVWPTESGGDGLVHLEAGVGRFDRDAVAAMHRGEPPTTTLARSVAMVRAERVAGGIHPLSRLARERWLRWSLLEEPSIVGATELRAVETTVRRDSVREVSPAAALGRSPDGRSRLVVCSVGTDLSFVPVAADTRAWLDPSAELVLAVPPRDRSSALDRLAGLLAIPATVVAVPEPWSVDPGRDADAPDGEPT